MLFLNFSNRIIMQILNFLNLGIFFFSDIFYKNFLQTFVYGDLYRCDVEKNEWKLVSSPNSPPPRSAHQAIAWKNSIYMFGILTSSNLYALGHISNIFRLIILCRTGGEFTSPNQERFHHYKVTLTYPTLLTFFFFS